MNHHVVKQCISQRRWPYSLPNLYIHFNVGKPRIEAEKETEIQVNAGDKLALDCTSSGYPTPVVTWHRVDGRPLQSGYIKHRGLLFLKKVDQLDRGKYQCISSNMYGNDTRIFSVNITGIFTGVSY